MNKIELDSLIKEILKEHQTQKNNSKELFTESDKQLLDENLFDIIHQSQQLLTDDTLVLVGGEMIKKGVALQAILGTVLGLPLAASASTWGNYIIKKFGSAYKALLAIIKGSKKDKNTNAPKKESVEIAAIRKQIREQIAMLLKK